MEVKKIAYAGWHNCYRLSNPKIELILTSDIGPRIIRFGFPGEENEFKEFGEQMGASGGDEWRIYGGHRLWHSPEAKPRTYHPDNDPVLIEEYEGYIQAYQPVESTTGIQKEMDIALDPNAARVTITHRLRNCGLWDVRLAVWALTVMNLGGTAIIPLPPRGSHTEFLLPTNTISLWAYTNMADPRWTWGQRFILFRQDPKWDTPQKVGAMVPDGWAAYARAGHLFVKKFNFHTGVEYPDMGCCVEVFNRGDMAELETLSPVVTLASGAIVEHVEQWELYRDVPVPQNDEDVIQHILPKIA